MINLQPFEEQWNKSYEVFHQQKGYFGAREQLRVQQRGPFTVLQHLGMGSKRPSEWLLQAQQQQKVYFPFDHCRFSFDKISAREIVACVDFNGKRLLFDHRHNQFWLIISGSPITEGHCLFVPHARQHHPQQMTEPFLSMAIALKQIMPEHTVCFNSQGAASSVNHFHLQLINLSPLLPAGFSPGKAHERQCWNGPSMEVNTFLLWGAFYVRVAVKKACEPGLICLLKGLCNLSQSLEIPFNLVCFDGSTLMIFRGFASESVPFGYLQMIGVVLAKTEQQFEQLSSAAISAKFQQIRLQQPQLALLEEGVGRIAGHLIF